MNLTDKELIKIITDAEVVDEAELQKAIDLASEEELVLWDVIVNEGLLSDTQLGQLVAAHLDVPFVDLTNVSINPDTLNLISRTVADEHTIIAFAETDDVLKVATTDPFDVNFFNVLQKLSGKDVVPHYTTNKQIERTLKMYRKGLQEDINQVLRNNLSNDNFTADGSESIISTIVSMIITYGFENAASDIHFEPADEDFIVRYRIDGILHDMLVLPMELHEKIVSRIKVLSRLRTDEHNSAQDGRLRFNLDEEELDVRVSVLPTAYGEKIVLRLLSAESKVLTLEELGLSGNDLKEVKKASQNSYGMILSTGPTGSGKTTTLYAILKILNKREVNITTIEDPIEYRMEGVNQIQVNTKTDLTFAKGLRSILRQDPDIIMVGEIRDEETAGIAVNASMTGHLVLSSLHTNDAATTLPRLLDMEIESYLVASTVNIIIAQRLVRKICNNCIYSFKLNKEQLANYSDILEKNVTKEKLKSTRFYAGEGCNVCNQSGFKGRIGVFEVLVVEDNIRELIKNKADSSEIEKAARANGMKSMLEDGIEKSLRGLTTLDEVLRVTLSH